LTLLRTLLLFYNLLFRLTSKFLFTAIKEKKNSLSKLSIEHNASISEKRKAHVRLLAIQKIKLAQSIWHKRRKVFVYKCFVTWRKEIKQLVTNKQKMNKINEHQLVIKEKEKNHRQIVLQYETIQTETAAVNTIQRYFRASTARSHSRSMVKGIGMTHRSLQTQLNAEKNENQNMIKELSANKKGKKKREEKKKEKKEAKTRSTKMNCLRHM
jgi:hypothetical protein